MDANLIRAALDKAEKERDEYRERVEAFEAAVDEHLPQVTCDTDGNLETNEICRIETVGLIYEELERRVERAEATRLAAERERDRAIDNLEAQMSNCQFCYASDAIAKRESELREAAEERARRAEAVVNAARPFLSLWKDHMKTTHPVTYLTNAPLLAGDMQRLKAAFDYYDGPPGAVTLTQEKR